jgi:membrane protein insertase Oxa1/YidC/SpoIIIJ
MFASSLGMASIPIVIAVLYILNRWMSTSDGKASSGKGNLPLYIMMAIGAFFLYRLITTGSF